VFARSTKGMKGRPYIARSVQEAADQAGVQLGAEIIDNWNKAG
jgi:hypothetical protein